MEKVLRLVSPSALTDPDSWIATDARESAVRFGRLLTTTRRRSKRSVQDLAVSGTAGFDATQLRLYEPGSAKIDESIRSALSHVFGRHRTGTPEATPGEHRRRPSLGCRSERRILEGRPDAVLVAYLGLIRRIRNQSKAPALALRRDDILILASHLNIDGADVVERLPTLLQVTPVQRTTTAMLFATGAIVIGLATVGHSAPDAGAIAVMSRTAETPSGASERAAIERQPYARLDRPAVMEAVVDVVESARRSST